MANTNPDYVNDFWEAYGDSSILVEVECDDAANGGSLAAHVLSTYNIPTNFGSSVGGNLKDLDIKRMDAMAVIKWSLLEATARVGLRDGKIYELIIDEDGRADFIIVGDSSASLNDIYYQVQSDTYREECSGVLLRGGNSMPSWKELDWKPIWGEGSYSSKQIYDTTRLTTNCMMGNYSTHTIITYNDPNLDSAYNDGINNLYELDNPFDKVLGYVQFIHAPGATNSTQINQTNTSVVPIQVGLEDASSNGPYMGVLQPRPSADETADNYAECWANTAAALAINLETEAVKIPLPDSLRFEDVRGTIVDKFVKIEQVIVQAQELSLVHTGATTDETAAQEDPDDNNTITVISMNNVSVGMFELEEGKHYVISYAKDSQDFKVPYIVFAKDARVNEPKKYGMDSAYKFGLEGETGYYKAGEEGIGTIFPVSENKGYLVEQIWVMVSLESPSITIYDPPFNDGIGVPETSLASEIADNLEFVIAPIVVDETPTSIAFSKGSGAIIIDQTPSFSDSDPTTTQDFTNTPLEEVYDDLNGGPGLELTLSFIREEDDSVLMDLAENLYDLLDEDYVETTYVCGPNTEVRLGEKGPSGGIINSISYSYSDSGSYTISVNEGSKIVGNFSGGGPTGPSMKQTESLNMRGTVIDSIGNGMFFKIRIDGYGERVAINMSNSLIREGDVVSCSIHNNPVED